MQDIDPVLFTWSFGPPLHERPNTSEAAQIQYFDFHLLVPSGFSDLISSLSGLGLIAAEQNDFRSTTCKIRCNLSTDAAVSSCDQHAKRRMVHVLHFYGKSGWPDRVEKTHVDHSDHAAP